MRETPMAEAPPRLRMEGITKRFPGVLANDHVGFQVEAGTIHALLGENGAGKSTLVKIIYGVLKPDSGQILWDGKPVSIANPRAARALGIGMVFQHFSLFEGMTVLENIALGMDEVLDRTALEARIHEILARYHLTLDPHRIVRTLSVGERQRIEIVRALLANPRLLIMDEPTSVLTPQEVDRLFEALRQMASEGRSILYISHKLHEIKALCHSATILRGGKVVGHCDPRQETPRAMAEMMIGQSLTDVRRSGGQRGAERLVVQGLSLAGDPPFGVSLRNINFGVRAGEILGIAGVAGNGQSEFVLALSGEKRVQADSIQLDGLALGDKGPSERRQAGLSVAPEERNGHAAASEFSLAENTLLTARGRKALTPRGIINARAAANYAAEIIARFGVKATGPHARAGSLSGGNLQKFLMGREILQAPAVLVVAQPTWGVDAGAAAVIHQALSDLAASGSAVVVISQDLDELLVLSDRIAVMNEGRLSDPIPITEATVERLGLLMGGVHGEQAGGMPANDRNGVPHAVAT